MRPSFSFLRLVIAATLRVSSASLSDLCTNAYVQSILPSGAISSITLLPSSVTLNAVYNYTVSDNSLFLGKSGLNFCNVTFFYTRNGNPNETTNVRYYLPDPGQFQSRFLATGGGGFAITSGESGLRIGLVYGAVTGTTDGGLGGWRSQLTNVILKANGTLNYDMLFNFGYRSIHEMTIIGKELTKLFYNSSKIYSYYQGCSEGGREGWSQVQRYSTQFDGAAIGAPAFRMPFLQVTHLFSAVVETTNNYYPSSCEMERIKNDTIVACDKLDGRLDGVVSRSDLCKLHFNASSSIGNSYSCAARSGGGGPMKRQMGGSPAPAVNGTVTAQAAKIASDIWKGLFDSQGRQAYISYQPAARFDDAATAYNSNTGKYEASVSGIGVQWVNLFLKEINSNTLSLTNVTYDTLRSWILEGMQKYADTLTNTWTDLEEFSTAGGKVIHYHGESDSSIPAGSSVIYHDAVRRAMYPKLGFNESYAQLHDWYRLFLVPGAGHCGPSADQPNGAFPQNVLGGVIDWVENGINPEKLNATVLAGNIPDVNQKLCSFPLRPYWSGNSTMECVYDQASIDSWLPQLDSIPLPVS